jgi:hypothetical protein
VPLVEVLLNISPMACNPRKLIVGGTVNVTVVQVLMAVSVTPVPGNQPQPFAEA